MIDLGRREDPAPDEVQYFSVELDWVAYFTEFERAHGGNPVKYQGNQLLYQDGYRYSATDHTGPEYPAPTDLGELRKLCKTYWSLRLARLKLELEHAKNLRNNLRDEQRKRSAPLQCKMTRLGDDGKMEVKVEAVDMTLLDSKVRILTDEVQRAQESLSQYKEQVHG